MAVVRALAFLLYPFYLLPYRQFPSYFIASTVGRHRQGIEIGTESDIPGSGQVGPEWFGRFFFVLITLFTFPSLTLHHLLNTIFFWSTSASFSHSPLSNDAATSNTAARIYAMRYPTIMEREVAMF